MNDKKLNDIRKKIQKDKDIAFEKVIELISKGVKVKNPELLDIRGALTCGKDVEIDLNVIIEGDVNLGDNVSIGANTILRNCSIGNGTKINPFSLIEDSIIGKNSFIGPYGRIRPNVSIGDYVQVGNFVEIKNSNIASKCRINHLSFVGDSDSGRIGSRIGHGPLTAPRGAWTPLGHATPWGVVSRSLRCTKQHLVTTTPKRID